VATALTAAGYVVTINAEKPRKGSFVVRCNDHTIVELLNLPRPFAKLRALDMEDIIRQTLQSSSDRKSKKNDNDNDEDKDDDKDSSSK
jgi:hypothetical protein